MSARAKIGAFFLGALALLGYLTFKAGDLGAVFQESFILKARFDHARGLKGHDPVAVSGVRVGEVKDLSLVAGEVLVELKIEKKRGVDIYPGAVARIVPAGLLGTKSVDITNGPVSKTPLGNGGEVKTAPGIDVAVALEKLDEAATAIRNMVSGEGKDNLVAIISNVSKITTDLADGKGAIGKLVVSDELYKKADDIAAELASASRTANKILADNQADVRSLIKNLSQASPEFKGTFVKAERLLDSINKGKGTLPGLIRDEKLYAEVKAVVAGFRAFADELAKRRGLAYRLVSDEQLADNASAAVRDLAGAAKEVREFMDKVDKGKGTLQLLLTDPSLYKEARRVLADAQETIRGVKEQIPVGTFTGLLLSGF